MPLQNIRLTTVVIAMIITLGLLLGSQNLYERYIVNEELTQEIEKVVNLEEIKIAKKEKPPTVYLRTSQIKDLQADYQKLEKIVHQQLGPEYQIILLDQRTPKLQALYEECQFPIYEAISMGNFQRMYQTLRKKAEGAHVNYRISVDLYNIYVQFQDRKGYLYEIIPRYPRLAIDEKGRLDGRGS